ncbi:maintenance of mitochondrial morphology protein 1 [Fistulina hepatica ATCC 64428]|uniref:Maintenance of mitochondrial morphology protein 1 n=1 Tax=Fistulina hepatica ATCC 64428 TaxID=1128425 RepID=A0A0D7A4V6_9AGAR|nr:maintenance of mitochondrial morphology protein 1 [Fistulina hepatica ATCC 64428]
MSANVDYPTFQLTFTQGLIFGQLSILILVAFILKYLFLDSSEYGLEASAFQAERHGLPRTRTSAGALVDVDIDVKGKVPDAPSVEWMNVLLRQILDVYRSKLCDDKTGSEGRDVALKRIEVFANRVRPASFIDCVKIHDFDFGRAAPSLSNPRTHYDKAKKVSLTEFDITYQEGVSVSLSTSYLFNYPTIGFARLPISLTISLALFQASMAVEPPAPQSEAPSISLTLRPAFTLKLATTSLLGSRAKLANVPKLHELIEFQLRRVLLMRGPWKVPLPKLVSVGEVREEVKKEIIHDSVAAVNRVPCEYAGVETYN